MSDFAAKCAMGLRIPTKFAAKAYKTDRSECLAKNLASSVTCERLHRVCNLQINSRCVKECIALFARATCECVSMRNLCYLCVSVVIQP